MATVGIGIPVRNGEQYIGEAIQSALNQNEPANEILLVLNNSKDSSATIAQGFVPSVRIVEDNSINSIGAAWNAVFTYSSCDYMVMLHQDDILYPDTISILKQLILEDGNQDMIFGRMNLLSSQGEVMRVNYSPNDMCLTGKAYLHRVMRDVLPGCSGMCAKRSVLLTFPYRTDLNILLDVEFFIRMGWLTKVRGIPNILSAYRIHSASTLHSDQSRKSQKDLLTWWKLLESGELAVPAEILSEYRACLFKRIVTAFLQDLWSDRKDYAHEWLNFLETVIIQYPYLMRQSFTFRSLLLFALAKSSSWGYVAASSIARIRENFRRKQYDLIKK